MPIREKCVHLSLCTVFWYSGPSGVGGGGEGTRYTTMVSMINVQTVEDLSAKLKRVHQSSITCH